MGILANGFNKADNVITKGLKKVKKVAKRVVKLEDLAELPGVVGYKRPTNLEDLAELPGVVGYKRPNNLEDLYIL